MTTLGDDKRGAFRYELDVAAHGEIGGQRFEGRLQDVSVTGAAVVGIQDTGYDNNQFVSLHMEGIGHRNGHMRRTIPDGFALEFESTEAEEQKKLEAAIQFRAMSASDRMG